MSPNLLLITESAQFIQKYREECTIQGVYFKAIRPSDVHTYIRPGQVAVFDAAASAYNNIDELHAVTAIVKAKGAVPAVFYPNSTADESTTLMKSLCQTLIATDAEEESILKHAAIQAAKNQQPVFEYVTENESGTGIVIVNSLGQCTILERPVVPVDDGSTVVKVTLLNAKSVAEITLESGRVFALHSDEIAARKTLPPGGTPASVIAANVRRLRETANMTQSELSKATGIHRPNIARLEAGKHTPTLETLDVLATALHTTRTELLKHA